MKRGDQQIYCFGEIQVDLSEHSVKRAGKELHIRQRSFEVLIYLLQNRGRLITKEELIENVWKVAAVTDDAIVQSVVEIRKAVGDDSRHPRFLKTVPKIGYRFIGPVEEIPIKQGPVQIEQIRSIEFEVEEELEERPKASLPAVQMNPVSSSQKWILLVFLLIATGIAFYASSRFLGPPKDDSTTAMADLPEKKTVVVAFFDNMTGDQRLDWLREGLADMLITGLSQSNRLTLVGRQQFSSILQRIRHKETERITLDEALEIARRSKAQAVVLGGFTRAGNQLRIDSQIYARDGQLIATDHLVIEKPEELLTHIDLLSLKIGARFGITPSQQGIPLEMTNVMTNNLDAYRYYSLAVQKTHGLRNTEAIDLLKKAIAVDSQFAMAHARIGYAYAVTWTQPDQAKPYLQKAFQLSERLTNKDKLYISAWYAIANQDYSSAIASFRKIVNQYPFELEAYSRLALLLKGERRYQEAIDTFRQGLVIDPETVDILNGLGSLYSGLGRHKEAISMHQKYLMLMSGEPNAHDSLGLSYQAAGQYQQAIEEYNRALALDPDFEIAVVHLGNTYLQLGRYADAIQEFERYIRIAPSEVERRRGFDCISYVHWKKGELDRAAQILEQHHQKKEVITQLLVDIDRRDDVRLESVKTQLATLVLEGRGARLESRIYYFPLGYALLKSGNETGAIDTFKKALASPAPTWHIDTYEDALGNAYLKLGKTDDAILEYRRILTLNPNYPLVHFNLAQAYEAKGSDDLARSEYEKFLQVWKDADRDVPQMEAALTRLRQLKEQI